MIEIKFQQIVHPKYKLTYRFDVADTGISVLIYQYKTSNSWCCVCKYNEANSRCLLGNMALPLAKLKAIIELDCFVQELKNEAVTALTLLSSEYIIK